MQAPTTCKCPRLRTCVYHGHIRPSKQVPQGANTDKGAAFNDYRAYPNAVCLKPRTLDIYQCSIKSLPDDCSLGQRTPGERRRTIDFEGQLICSSPGRFSSEVGVPWNSMSCRIRLGFKHFNPELGQVIQQKGNASVRTLCQTSLS